MRAVDWLPIRLANSLREFYTTEPYGLDDPPPEFKRSISRGRFPDAAALSTGRPKFIGGKGEEDRRTVALTWRLTLIESEALIDGPAPAYGIQFRVELLHGEAPHCAAVMDLLSDNIRPYMVSLDAIYDKDDDPTVQEFRLQACVAEFSLMADGLPEIDYA